MQHLYGLVCRDFEALIDLARAHRLWVIEDCAHAAGAQFRNQKVGNFSDVAIYSCEQSKILNTIQGGLAVTNQPQIAARLARWRDAQPFPEEGRVEKLLCNVLLNFAEFKNPENWLQSELAQIRYGQSRVISTTEQEMRGIRPNDYGRRMAAPTAALGLNQLKKADRYNQKRRQQAQRWDQWCQLRGYRRPFVLEGSSPVYLRYPVMVEPEKKSDTSWAARELRVDLGVWFVSHVYPAGWTVEGCPNADQAVQRCVNFPSLLE